MRFKATKGAVEELEALRIQMGKRDIAETIRSALKTAKWLIETQETNLIILKDKKTGEERETILKI